MALTESEIKVIIAAEIRKAGFDKAKRATSDLEKQFKKLGGTIASVFAARKIIAFTKASAKAFAEEDKAVRSLAYSMESLGLAFQGANIESYVSATQRAAAVSDGLLRPALQSLINTTLDIEKAQSLLNLALDISAATGKDLQAVTNGLSRAYLKDVSALAKLNLGLTDAQLKTMSFAEAQELLNSKFGGQAALVADTYAGKVNALTIAFDEAKEVIGKDFIRALEIIGDGDFDKALDAIAKAANAVGNAFIRAGYGIQKVKALLRGDFDQIKKLQEQMNLELLGGFGVTARPIAGILNKQTAAQRKLLAAQEAARKKAEALEKKREAERLARKRASTIFDMENIQIVAALQGKIDGEERLRLTTLLALNTDNVTAAEKLADIVIRLNAPALSNLGVMIQAGDTIDEVIQKLITSQAKLAGLQLMAEDFPELDNIFEDWETSLENILKMLMEMFNLLNNKKALTGIYGVDALGFSSPEAYRDYRSGERGDTYSNPSGFSIIGSSSMSNGSVVPSGYSTSNMNVTVNVAGNVTTEKDLVSAITEQLYVQQKSGKQVLYNSLTV